MSLTFSIIDKLHYNPYKTFTCQPLTKSKLHGPRDFLGLKARSSNSLGSVFKFVSADFSALEEGETW